MTESVPGQRLPVWLVAGLPVPVVIAAIAVRAMALNDCVHFGRLAALAMVVGSPLIVSAIVAAGLVVRLVPSRGGALLIELAVLVGAAWLILALSAPGFEDEGVTGCVSNLPPWWPSWLPAHSVLSILD